MPAGVAAPPHRPWRRQTPVGSPPHPACCRVQPPDGRAHLCRTWPETSHPLAKPATGSEFKGLKPVSLETLAAGHKHDLTPPHPFTILLLVHLSQSLAGIHPPPSLGWAVVAARPRCAKRDYHLHLRSDWCTSSPEELQQWLHLCTSCTSCTSYHFYTAPTFCTTF